MLCIYILSFIQEQINWVVNLVGITVSYKELYFMSIII